MKRDLASSRKRSKTKAARNEAEVKRWGKERLYWSKYGE
jgi:hypothetical protein